MKELQIIQTKQGMVAVSDVQAKSGEWCVDKYNYVHRFVDLTGNGLGSEFMPTIILTEQSLKLDGVAQFEVEDTYGRIAAVAYANDVYSQNTQDEEEYVRWINRKDNFLNGYKAAQSKYRFTEEDVRKIILHSFLRGVDRSNYSIDVEDEILKQYSASKQLKSIVVDSLESENGIVKPLKYIYND